MQPIRTSILIEAKLTDVFRAFTDFERAAERIRGIKRIEVLTAGPVGVGTRFRETREMFRREVTEELEITDFKANENYEVQAESCGARYVANYDFAPQDNGTHVKLAFAAQPVTWLAKLMSPVNYLMQGSVKRLLDQDLEDLRDALEHELRGN